MIDKEVGEAILSKQVVCLRACILKTTTYPAGIVLRKHGRDTRLRMLYEVLVTSPGWGFEVGYLVAARADEMFISEEYLCRTVNVES